MTASPAWAQPVGGLVLPADLTAGPPAGAVTEVGPTPEPTQAPSGGLESWEVTPGLLGFIPVFLIALACVGLFLSLTRHMRRVTVRQALRDAEDEAAARRADGGPAADGPAVEPGRPAAGEGPSDRP